MELKHQYLLHHLTSATRARKPKNTSEVVVKVVDCSQQGSFSSQQQHRQ